MAKAYWIGAYRSVFDSAKLEAYAKLAGPAVAASGGRFLARGGKVKANEAGLAERTVVVEFDNFEQAVVAYESQAYQRALAVLGDGVERDHRIVEGVD